MPKCFPRCFPIHLESQDHGWQNVWIASLSRQDRFDFLARVICLVLLVLFALMMASLTNGLDCLANFAGLVCFAGVQSFVCFVCCLDSLLFFFAFLFFCALLNSALLYFAMPRSALPWLLCFALFAWITSMLVRKRFMVCSAAEPHRARRANDYIRFLARGVEQCAPGITISCALLLWWSHTGRGNRRAASGDIPRFCMKVLSVQFRQARGDYLGGFVMAATHPRTMLKCKYQ